MIVFQEKIAPPTLPSTRSEQYKLEAEAAELETRWVKSFIDYLTGDFRDVKH
jgi:hypothetical protein